MADTNPRPWRDRITVDEFAYLDGELMSGEQWFDALRGVLDESLALAAEVERLRGSDLPDGVQPWTGDPIEIDGVPVVGVAMGDVVRGLDDEWLATIGRRDPWRSIGAGANPSLPYLLGRKPQPTPPPTVTVELPQDVAERYGTERVQVDDHEVVLDSIAKALGR